MENADDIRLSVQLLRMCSGEMQVFCADVEPGVCMLSADSCRQEHQEHQGRRHMLIARAASWLRLAACQLPQH